MSLAVETELSPQLASWLAFAKEKCHELKLLKDALITQDSFAITQYSAPVLARLGSEQVNDQTVQKRVADLSESNFNSNCWFYRAQTNTAKLVEFTLSCLQQP